MPSCTYFLIFLFLINFLVQSAICDLSDIQHSLEFDDINNFSSIIKRMKEFGTSLDLMLYIDYRAVLSYFDFQEINIIALVDGKG
jgi:hypothetical protein